MVSQYNEAGKDRATNMLAVALCGCNFVTDDTAASAARRPAASIRTFRADGIAVLLAVPGGAQTTYTLVLLGKPDPSPGDRVIFQATDDVRRSVRLR